MAVTASEFIQNIRASGLLEGDDLVAAQALANKSDLDGQGLAVRLVQARKLTAYQAKQLLAGNTRGFFLEKYKILEPIGRGGMGLVFKAEHTMLGRLAAIKVLPRRAASDREAVARFRRESRATAQLEHENIVRVYDVGQQGQAYFFAMEFVQGKSLSRTIKNHVKLPVREAVSIIYQVALGLDHAYSRGIIHRDIKPSNILVTPEGKAKILDMGLARVFGMTAEEGAAQMSLTMSGTVVGTVDYVAPEQADDSHKADVRSDIYSLGCTLYECVTGRVPFPGGTMMQKLMKHYRSNPTEVSELSPDVPPALVAVIKRMMAKRQKDRFQRPSDVADALLPFLSVPGEQFVPNSAVIIAQKFGESETASVHTSLSTESSTRAPDVSHPTLPTIPLGTPTPDRQNGDGTDGQAAKELVRSDGNGAATNPKRPIIVEPNPASAPVLSATATPVGPAAETEFDLAAMDWTGSTVRPNPRKKQRVQGFNEVLDAIAVAASESPPSAAMEVPAAPAWTRTHALIAGAASVTLLIAAAFYYWTAIRPGTLVLQYPQAYSTDLAQVVEQKNGRVLVDGKPLRIAKSLRQEFKLSAGFHRIVVELPHLNQVNEPISVQPGKPVLVQLTPTHEKMRVWGLANLKQRVVDLSPSDRESDELLAELNQFASRHRGTVEGSQALALRTSFRWPLDRLSSQESAPIQVAQGPDTTLRAISLIATLTGADQSPVTSMIFSPNGQYLACGRIGGNVEVWDANGPTTFRTVGDQGKPVIQLGFLEDSARVSAASSDRIIVWDVSTGSRQSEVKLEGGAVAAAHSSNGATMGCAFQDGHVSLYQTASGVERGALSGFLSEPRTLAISSAGSVLAVGGKEKVELWDIAGQKRTGQINLPGVSELSFSEDDLCLALVGDDGEGRVWRAGAAQFSVRTGPNCRAMVFCPTAQTVAALINGRTIQLFRSASGELIGAFMLLDSAEPASRIALAPDARHMAFADSKGIVRVLRLEFTP